MLDFISQLFTDLNTTDSIMVLFFLLGSFLIGLFAGRASINKKWKRAERELMHKENDLLSTRAERDTLLKEGKARQVELETATGFLSKAKKQLTQTQQDRDQFQQERDQYEQKWQASQEQMIVLEQNTEVYQSQISSLSADVEKTQAAREMLRVQAQQLEEESAGLRLEVHQLLKEKEQLQAEAEQKTYEQSTLYSQGEEATNSRIGMIENKMERLAIENERLQETILNLNKTAHNSSTPSAVDMDSINQRLAQLEEENQQLKLNVAELQEGEEELEVLLVPVMEGDEIEEIEIDSEVIEEGLEEELEEYNFISTKEKSDIARAKLKSVFGHKIPIATAAEKNDLQVIDGIGPFIEEQLNAVGIFTFEQISSFDKEAMNLVTDAIQFFPGRIKRDDWKGQAARQLVKMAR